MITKELLEGFCIRVLETVGVDAVDAEICAQILVHTDMRGVYTHGTRVLPYLVQQIQSGGIRPRATLQMVKQGPAYALLDGRHALGHVVAYRSMQIAMEKAGHYGLGMTAVRRGNHFGAAGMYALMCANHDMIGLAMCNTCAIMAVTGSSERTIGNNPIAFAAPAGEEGSIVVDIALSVAAASKLAILMNEERHAPEGWLLNALGEPSINPRDFFEQDGMLLPAAGHKGYGLALLVEVLAAVITGASITTDVNDWVKQPDRGAGEGYVFIAIHLKSFISWDEYKSRIEMLIRRIRAARKACGIERIYVPGEMERECEQRARLVGIFLAPHHVESLVRLAQQLGLEKQYSTEFFA